MFQTKVVENIKTHILCSITFFKNRVTYVIMGKKFVEPGRPQITTWHMHIAYWIHCQNMRGDPKITGI